MTTRVLPAKRNPIFAVGEVPEHSELIAKRRLGQTTLKAKPGLVGNTNATKPENLGSFEYAHLKVALPDNLSGTDMFSAPYPEAYFLMRRSSDGHVSATGMFKATFPWAKFDEEQQERQYIKNLSTTAQDEVAGNVWITESAALSLADEYHIRPWIIALLDPTPIPTDDKKHISSPPMYRFKANEQAHLPPSLISPSKSRKQRAASPSKKEATSPKKRVTKAVKEANAATARQASEVLQSALDAASVRSESVEPTVNGGLSPSPAVKTTKKKSKKADKESAKEPAKTDGADKSITVNVQTTVQTDGDQQTEQTTVQVKMPEGVPELPTPENMEQVIADAKKMVEEARALEQNGDASGSKSKRKAEILDADDELNGSEEVDSPETKRIRLAEQQAKKRTVLSRALAGVVVSLAVGAVVPYVLGG